LAVAGVSSDAAFPSDGINLLPIPTQNAAPVERKLFWRYKANAQRAARDGDYKYLKILDNTFLFNVVEDPMERANLKERRKDVYDRITAEWYAWNATMLPEIDESYTDNFTGGQLADHIGTPKTNGCVAQDAVSAASLKARRPLPLPRAVNFNEFVSHLGKGGKAIAPGWSATRNLSTNGLRGSQLDWYREVG
jgi:hypothetical protein